jgi:hypothetical protein
LITTIDLLFFGVIEAVPKEDGSAPLLPLLWFSIQREGPIYRDAALPVMVDASSTLFL